MTANMLEPLIRAVHSFADAEANATGESAPVREKLNALGLSDEILSAIGLDWLLPEPDETPEPDQKEFTVRYSETWTGLFTVCAANAEEADAEFQKMLDEGIDTLEEMELSDNTWDIFESKTPAIN